jgi:hypothetical protein
MINRDDLEFNEAASDLPPEDASVVSAISGLSALQLQSDKSY